MFCPSCGSKENHSNQFCRSCGANISSVRVMLESPDSITASAVSARDEIGRAIAAKIQQTSDSDELSEFAENVLPEIEKFLESPEEKRLRRIRAGSTVSFIGLGVTIATFIASQIGDGDLIMLSVLGLITFFVGISLTVNGVFFTVPQKSIGRGQNSDSDFTNELEGFNTETNELLMPPNANREFRSVTEPTTRHLRDKIKVK